MAAGLSQQTLRLTPAERRRIHAVGFWVGELYSRTPPVDTQPDAEAVLLVRGCETEPATDRAERIRLLEVYLPNDEKLPPFVREGW